MEYQKEKLIELVKQSDNFKTIMDAKAKIAEYESILVGKAETSESSQWRRQEIERMKRQIEDYRNHFIEKVNEAYKPLITDDDRVEIIMLVVGNDRDIAEDAIRGILTTQTPFKLTVYENSNNTMNTSKVWNKLIRESTCPYVLLIDSDAIPAKWAIDELMLVMKKNMDAAVVVPVSGTESEVTTLQRIRSQDKDAFTTDGHISGYCMLFRKSIFDELGYFDEDFVFYGQDSDWVERVLEQNKYKLYVVPRALVTHGRNGGASISSSIMEKEGKFNRGIDSEYSHFLFDMKKYQRSLPTEERRTT